MDRITTQLAIAALALTLFATPGLAADQAPTAALCAETLAPLIDRGSLATLGKRRANPRVQKAAYWLATARSLGLKSAKGTEQGAALAGYTNATAARLTKDALLRNLDLTSPGSWGVWMTPASPR